MFSMIVFALFFKYFKCLKIPLLAILFVDKFVFIVFLFLAVSHHAHFMFVQLFSVFCVFPLLGDKQGFKFRGVMGILYTHFILTFWLAFSVFLLYK